MDVLNKSTRKKTEAGFSLLELIIAMGISLAVMTAASTLLATSLRTRARENTRSEALASAQRALNIMTREIGNSGYGLTDNGIVVLDSDDKSIRVRANLNNNTTLANTANNDVDEDVRFAFQLGNRAILRVGDSGTVVLATNITGLTIRYLDMSGNNVTAATAERVNIDVSVDLPAGLEQPHSVVRLVSDVALRNGPGTLQQF
ncbi:MAG: prepilin-type N-terminal cleavage/methylation domain-containing protein [bacterium]